MACQLEAADDHQAEEGGHQARLGPVNRTPAPVGTDTPVHATRQELLCGVAV